ncbi:MAG: nucleotidyltransferase domain-containing protein [Epsilonproteobacteria bacterium]|nr:MAG: nucleotidyltransferase domain-containing protein [Campylobacterota bacterium]
MIDIEELKPLIIEKLKSLNPDKIILFGSYAYGTPNEDSDIDLFLIKDDLTIEDTRYYQREAKKQLLDIRTKYKTNGIDILSAPTKYIEQREDYFYKIDILQNGKVWYERTIS